MASTLSAGRSSETFLTFFRRPSTARPAPPGSQAGAALLGDVRWQLDVTAVWKLQVTQPDMAGTALDHIAGADRKLFGQTNCWGTHDDPPSGGISPRFRADNAGAPRQFRDSLATL